MLVSAFACRWVQATFWLGHGLAQTCTNFTILIEDCYKRRKVSDTSNWQAKRFHTVDRIFNPTNANPH